MKQILSVLLILCLIFALSSCTNNRSNTVNQVTYYYRTAEVEFGPESSMIAAEIRNIKGYTDDYPHLVEQYLYGPVSDDCVSPYPAGITLEELNIDDNKVQIMLSPHLALLSGAELMTACACLAKTLMELTGLKTIQISADSGLLNGMEVITLTEDDFVYWDDGAQFTSP